MKSKIVGKNILLAIENGERNLLNPGVMADLISELRTVKADEKIFGVVISGAGK